MAGIKPDRADSGIDAALDIRGQAVPDLKPISITIGNFAFDFIITIGYNFVIAK